ncbi:MAG TPA: adenylate/guanylate cyclase domain-containing protein [Solirubrobacterales bacterium]
MADDPAKEFFEKTKVRYRVRSLEDFLIETPLNGDAQLNDGWGAYYPMKGCEIEATILFADITAFSRRTLDLTPMETLSFVNNFFAWITAESLRGSKGVIDKYIGDEVMVVFSKDFGSKDPFREAVEAARYMADHDVHSYMPHIGLASGRVVIGYVGTPLKYSATVLGHPVAMAARCAGVKPDVDGSTFYTTSISFPAADWGERDFDEVFPAEKFRIPPELRVDGEGEFGEQPHGWEMLPPQTPELKNMPGTEIISIINKGGHFSSTSAEERARQSVAWMRKNGAYRPRWRDEA